MTDDLFDDFKLLADDDGPSEDARQRARERLTTRMAAVGPVARQGRWERARWALAPTAAAALALIVGISVLNSEHTGRVGSGGVTFPDGTSTYPDDHARKLGKQPKRRAKAKPKPAAPTQESVPPASSSPSAGAPAPKREAQGVLPAPPETDQLPATGGPDQGAGGGTGGEGESPGCSPAEAPPASTTPAPPATSTPQEPACPPTTPPPTTTQPPTTTEPPKEGNPTP